MRFVKNMYLSDSIKGKEKKIERKLNMGIGVTGVYCIAVPLYGRDPLEIYSVIELKQRWYRKNPLLIVGMTSGKKEAELLAADILSDIHEKQGDFDSRRFFGEDLGVEEKETLLIEERNGGGES